MARLRMAVIGVGHLGKEHARIVASLPDVELVGVVDTNADQGRAVAQRLGTQAFTSWQPLRGQLDAACVAASTRFHAALATELLQHRIPVLVEKRHGGSTRIDPKRSAPSVRMSFTRTRYPSGHDRPLGPDRCRRSIGYYRIGQEIRPNDSSSFG